MRAKGESIVNIRMTMLRGTVSDDRTAPTSTACVALPLRDARAPAGNANLHCGETTLHWSNAPLHCTETPLSLSNAPKRCRERSLHDPETTQQAPNAPLHCSNACFHCSNARLHCSNACLHRSNAHLHCSNASVFRFGTWNPGRRWWLRHAPARTSCVHRGRCIARMTGSHANVPSPHWRSTVFK